MQDFYIVDRNGRLARRWDVSSERRVGEARNISRRRASRGDLVGQAAAVTLAHAEDLAIDELSRVVYWVSDGEIWRAIMPLDAN